MERLSNIKHLLHSHITIDARSKLRTKEARESWNILKYVLPNGSGGNERDNFQRHFNFHLAMDTTAYSFDDVHCR